MKLFSRNRKAKAAAEEAEQQPLDPIALCLAVWLGAMVCVLGVVRLLEGAAQAAHAADMAHRPLQPAAVGYPMVFAS